MSDVALLGHRTTASQQSTKRTSSNMAEGQDPERGLAKCEFTIDRIMS